MFLLLTILTIGGVLAADQVTSEDFASSFTGQILSAIIQELMQGGNQILSYLMAKIPSDLGEDYGFLYTVAGVVEHLAYWLPMDFLMGIYLLYLAHQLTFIVVKMIVKIIPTVG